MSFKKKLLAHSFAYFSIHIHITESRRDQEEGGELDCQEEASPEEIKSREVVLG